MIGCPARQLTGPPPAPPPPKGEKIAELPAVHFDLGSAEVKEGQRARVEELREVMRQNPDIAVSIEGHSEKLGSPAEQIRLSEERANGVAEDLVRAGIPPERIVTAAHGAERPIADPATAEGQAQNRRVEAMVVDRVVTTAMTPRERTVYYGTTRARKPGVSLVAYGNDERDDLEVGVCTVSIPERHVPGEVESPGRMSRAVSRVLGRPERNPERHFVIKTVDP